jgi:superkiller protein 3
MRVARATLSVALAFVLLQAGCSKKQANRNAGQASANDNAAQGQQAGGDARAFFDRGMDAYKHDRDEEAVEDFRQAVQLDPDFAEAYYRLGIALHVTGQTDESKKAFEQAVKAYEKLTDREPKNSDAFYFLGLCYERLDQFEDAVDALEDAVRTSPNEDDDKYYELALANYKLAHYDEAVVALNKALEINPDNYPAQDLLQQAKDGAARVAEIRKHQEQLLKQKNANANMNGNSNAAANTNANAAASANKNGAASTHN